MDPNNEVCFDGWTLDLRSGELCREGVRVRLQTRPQQLLEELLAQPGELVAREHLIARLWPRGVVDFDTALNSTVRRLRTVLGDHAESPRYIETIPRRGYRFIGRLGPTTIEPPAQRRSPRLLPHWSPVAAAVGVLALALATTVTGLGTQSPRDTSVADVLSVEQSATEVLERARYFLQRRQDSDLERAELYFNEALASKPDLADAWAGLASVHWLQTVQNQRPLAEGLAQTRFAAERALQLDPLQPEARLRLANYWWLSGDRAAGDRHFARALAAAPGHGLVLSFAASRAADEGRLADAIAIQRRAVAADPLSSTVRHNLANLLYLAGHVSEARVEVERLAELSAPGTGSSDLYAMLLVLDGRFTEALSLASGWPDGVDKTMCLALAYHGLGRAAESDAALRVLISEFGDIRPLAVAEVQAYRGDRDQAFAWLHRAATLPDTSAAGMVVENPIWTSRYSPWLRSLHTDPRWPAWMNQTRHLSNFGEARTATRQRKG